jgi:hypothetical protein
MLGLKMFPPDWHREAILAERLAAHRANKNQGKDWEELEKDLTAERKAITEQANEAPHLRPPWRRKPILRSRAVVRGPGNQFEFTFVTRDSHLTQSSPDKPLMFPIIEDEVRRARSGTDFHIPLIS